MLNFHNIPRFSWHPANFAFLDRLKSGRRRRKNSAVEFECWQRSMINKSNQLQEFDTMTTRPMTMETQQLEGGKNVFFFLASAESKRREKEQKIGKITSKGFINNNNIFCSIAREIFSSFFRCFTHWPSLLRALIIIDNRWRDEREGLRRWNWKFFYTNFENISSFVICDFVH